VPDGHPQPRPAAGVDRGFDRLVAELMRSLASAFSEHKQQLEGQWQRGDDVATEDLRLAFQRYRTFFNQLLKH
jgi:hypothetical protein